MGYENLFYFPLSHSMNTSICCHDKHFFQLLLPSQLGEEHFHDDIKIIQIVPLSSQGEQSLISEYRVDALGGIFELNTLCVNEPHNASKYKK